MVDIIATVGEPISLRAKARQEWMDVVRGVCILLVIGLHAALIIERFGETPWQPLVEFNQLFAPYRMPMLMFLSGLLLERSLRKGPLVYAEGKVRRILYPYMLWTCVFGLVVTPQFEWHNPWLWMGASYLWYLFFLMLCYAIAPFLRQWNSLAVAVVCLLISYLMPDGTKYQERLFCLMGYFFLGDFVATSGYMLRVLKARLWLNISVPIAAWLSYAAFLDDGLSYRAELVLPTFAGIIVLIHLARRLSGFAVAAPLKFVGRNSIIFYIVHYPVMFSVINAILTHAPATSKPTIAAVTFVVSLAICGLVAWGSHRAPAIQALFVLPVPRLRPLER